MPDHILSRRWWIKTLAINAFIALIVFGVIQLIPVNRDNPPTLREPAWDSPWGPGRPGWHIECSAMSTCCLGNHFDIHGGGQDLQFPHHENEIAQSEAATGEQFVNYWMHNGFVRIDDEKMSKSLGNFFTVREILEKYRAEDVRYFILASHYRSPLNYSDQMLDSAGAALSRLYTALRDIDIDEPGEAGDEYIKQFDAVMDDDFNSLLWNPKIDKDVGNFLDHSFGFVLTKTFPDVYMDYWHFYYSFIFRSKLKFLLNTYLINY